MHQCRGPRTGSAGRVWRTESTSTPRTNPRSTAMAGRCRWTTKWVCSSAPTMTTLQNSWENSPVCARLSSSIERCSPLMRGPVVRRWTARCPGPGRYPRFQRATINSSRAVSLAKQHAGNWIPYSSVNKLRLRRPGLVRRRWSAAVVQESGVSVPLSWRGTRPQALLFWGCVVARRGGRNALNGAGPAAAGGPQRRAPPPTLRAWLLRLG